MVLPPRVAMEMTREMVVAIVIIIVQIRHAMT
jgi:hypothetical protein